MEVQTALVKYVFVDIVKYSHERTVEAQSDIINTLNTIVKRTIKPFNLNTKNVIFLPTGDGVCICIINIIDPYDIHLQIAIKILQELYNYNNQQVDMRRQFNLRIGINENYDNIINDINGNTNVAGAGINFAQRIMGMAEDNQIFIGKSVFEKLVQREKYNDKFHIQTQQIKHGISYTAYQYIDDSLPFVSGLKKELPVENHIEESIPKQIAVYRFFAKYFEEDIITLSGYGVNNYALKVLLYFMTDDYINYDSLDELERKKWKSKIFSDTVDSFDKAYNLISEAFIWLVIDACDYYKEKLCLYKWKNLFKNDYLLSNKNLDKKVKSEWPHLYKEMDTYLPLMYPWLQNNTK